MKIFFKITIFAVAFTAFISNSHAQTNFVRDSVVLAYRPNSSVLLVDYKNNSKQLDNILNFVKANQYKLQNNQSHINVVSYIKPYEVGNPEAINNASIQASVVRAQFKSKYNIPHSAITFSIDTTQNVNNQVRVDYIATPVPAYSNNAIYYTESTSISLIKSQISKYKPSVPYTNYWMHLAKLNPEMLAGVTGLSISDNFIADAKTQTNVAEVQDDEEDLEEVVPVEEVAVVEEVAAKEALPVVTTVTTTVTQTATEQKTSDKKVEKKTEKKQPKTIDYSQVMYVNKQVFGLKTNLLSWACATPNLEMEFYVGKRVSLNFEGAYTWGWFLPMDKAYFYWNAGAEVRFWFKNDAKFNGHFMGIYGNTGQFDFKFGQYGNQGDYYGVGITYGYMLPIGKSFHMEFSIGAGWANYSLLKYEHIGGLNFEVESTPAKNYFGITKAKVGCVWKF